MDDYLCALCGFPVKGGTGSAWHHSIDGKWFEEPWKHYVCELFETRRLAFRLAQGLDEFRNPRRARDGASDSLMADIKRGKQMEP